MYISATFVIIIALMIATFDSLYRCACALSACCHPGFSNRIRHRNRGRVIWRLFGESSDGYGYF